MAADHQLINAFPYLRFLVRFLGEEYVECCINRLERVWGTRRLALS